jgi:hypothetical protein
LNHRDFAWAEEGEMATDQVSDWTIDVLVAALTRNQLSADELRDILKRITPADRSRLFTELDRVLKHD